MAQGLRKAAVLALLPLLLAGCGVRGSLEAPKQAKQKGVATSPEAADNGPKSSAPPKPHRDFLLDPLLR
jgi:predicted small lipoprotein YifL